MIELLLLFFKSLSLGVGFRERSGEVVFSNVDAAPKCGMTYKLIKRDSSLSFRMTVFI
jgi:hypothetical protein